MLQRVLSNEKMKAPNLTYFAMNCAKELKLFFSWENFHVEGIPFIDKCTWFIEVFPIFFQYFTIDQTKLKLTRPQNYI